MAAGVLGRAPAGAGAAPRGARHDARLLALDRPHGAPAARRCDGWGVGPARAEAGRVAAEAGTSGQPGDAEDLDVSGVFVDIAFRSTPSQASPDDSKARIVFVSESGVCRSVLAEATMRRMLHERGLHTAVECASKATRDYNVDEPPEAVVREVASEQDLLRFIPEGKVAETFDYAEDIVHYDLVLVMDKFTAADVLREVSVYDTIDKEGGYSGKVRLLGEFHPSMATNIEPGGQDIDDPLYGNVGGAEEKAAVAAALRTIMESCEGLVRFLEELVGSEDSRNLAQALRQAVPGMKTIQWLVPPMLQTR